MAYKYCTVAFLQMMKESNIATCSVKHRGTVPLGLAEHEGSDI